LSLCKSKTKENTPFWNGPQAHHNFQRVVYKATITLSGVLQNDSIIFVTSLTWISVAHNKKNRKSCNYPTFIIFMLLYEQFIISTL